MSANQHQIFLQALRIMLKPIIKFCLRRSIKIQDLNECCKLAFIDAAAEEIENSEGLVSINRLSMRTGVHRPDVRRLYKEKQAPKHSGDILRRVIGCWQQDKRFTTKAKKPRVLSLAGENNEFAKLVGTVSADPNHYTVLSELINSGFVERSGKKIKLKTRVYLPKNDLINAMMLLAKNVNHLMEAVDENVASANEIPNYHLETDFDNVIEDALPAVRKWLLAQGSAFHHRIRLYLAKYDKDANPELINHKGGVRVVVGGYSHILTQG